jgi:ABC-2 type transport system permease protein
LVSGRKEPHRGREDLPIRNTPLVVQSLSYLDPVGYFREVVRGIFFKGFGLPVLWPGMLVALLIYGTVSRPVSKGRR